MSEFRDSFAASLAELTGGSRSGMASVDVAKRLFLSGPLADVLAENARLRDAVETWIEEAPEQTAGLDLLRQIIGRPR